LVSRFGGAVHVLTENVRQVDPLERAALNQLRSGDVEAAIAWYFSAGRISVSPDRDTALDATVAGWATDVCTGEQAAMYAWKRANVAELNRRGREAWEEMGRLSGPELAVGDISYRAGDRIVALAPGAGGAVVTSECGTVVAVDVARRELGATMDDDGRFQRFGPEEIDASHLAHGYAVTVHRAQGATVGRAHALEDGGGRELAYVKMSRARECSTVYVVADSVEQATEDLCRSWSQSRRIGWAIDRGTPAPGADVTEPARPSPALSASLRHARLVAEREALAAVIPADPRYALRDAERRVQHLELALNDLDHGNGGSTWKGTPVGEAAVAWRSALSEWRSCTWQAEHGGWRERHGLRRRAGRAAEREGPLREAFERLAGPERERLEAELPEAKKLYEEFCGRYAGHVHYTVAHPEALRRLDLLDIQIRSATWELDVEREGLDGIAPRPAQRAAPSRELERDIEVLDRGIDLEL
jgi:hypothetical protein